MLSLLPGRKIVSLSWGTVHIFFLLVFLLISGCAESERVSGRLKKLYEDAAVPEPYPVLRKKDIGTLSPARLEKLIVSSLYTGPPERYGIVVLEDTKGMAPVVFPHSSHRSLYTCQVCHMELEFNMLNDSDEISCQDNRAGRHCGECHNGTTAFSVTDEETRNCNRCHLDINNPNAMKKIDLRFKELAKTLPEKPFGDGIDWAKALNTRLITPKKSLYGEENTQLFSQQLKEPLRWNTAAPRVNVYFPHESHVSWLDCSNCHPDIFDVEKLGTVSFDKVTYLNGQFCGSCHMRVAFPINNCSRCHPGVDDWAQ